MKKSIFPWILFFLLLFILSLDFWWWDAPINFGWLNLPAWIFYFVLLQLVFAAGFYLFSEKYWREPSDRK